MNSRPMSIRPIVAPLLFLLCMALGIVYSEGVLGFAPFLDLSGILFLPSMVLLAIVGAQFRLSDFFKALWHSICRAEPGQAAKDARILSFAASAAISSGILVSLIGVIIILNGMDDYVFAAKRMALPLVSIFYGFFLSDFVLAPMSRHLAGTDKSAP